MLLLGLLLMAGAGAFTGLLIADNLAGGPHYTVSVLGHDIATMNTLGAFLTGVALTLLFGLGLLLLLSAGARRRRRAAAVDNPRVVGTAPESAADPVATEAEPAAGHRWHLPSRHRLSH
ncbi:MULTISPECIES: hypothetical protein [Kitasatospora]|uniref:hypothetical protein n=1 Tax=Kitasatospora TaxID=2063 RepID=UPI000C70C870|nr:hypothetical protein [Kitasatospora sp. GP30]MDH6143500.1 hypothetical protein [Kitasatospora sp. GP30]